ncbi:predicted protein [Histoplasma mississippiense (nom. inval.)]|uniref:predicted protein n=1 Tax=Ajellomyces capsulatus (strain NAm1 / WU24) TaxID=2059318 RepID=UPI000157D2AE|nr:predicted protein [Histoplasma mississippiense (nom. inval.)]EDN04432.1 predicted protein [Histoplasma mississippiense (nom. inval.)]
MACLRPAELACIDHTSARGTRETGRLVQVQKVKNAPSDCIHPQSETGGVGRIPFNPIFRPTPDFTKGSGIVAMDKKTSHLLGPPREAQFQVNLFQALGGNRYSPTIEVYNVDELEGRVWERRALFESEYQAI